MYTQWRSHGANRGHAPLKAVHVVHTASHALTISHKFCTASDEHLKITHTRGRARTCVYEQRLKRFITRYFFLQLNRMLKAEQV